MSVQPGVTMAPLASMTLLASPAQSPTSTILPSLIPTFAGRAAEPVPHGVLYLPQDDLRLVKNGHGVGIISTSKGLLTVENAKEQGLGGEYICEVY